MNKFDKLSKAEMKSVTGGKEDFCAGYITCGANDWRQWQVQGYFNCADSTGYQDFCGGIDPDANYMSCTCQY